MHNQLRFLQVAIFGSGLILSSSWLSAQEMPNGKEIVNAACNVCHQLSQRVGGGYSAENWSKVLRMMQNQGLSLTPEQLAAAREYLIATYPEKAKPEAKLVDGPVKVTMQAWQAPTPGSRPHDPLGASDGSIWYTGQMANILGRVNPVTGEIKEFPLKTPHSGPHGLMEDKQGNIWYTGNTGSLMGKLNPKTGANTEYPLPSTKPIDPHSLAIDQQGIVWFTAQVGNRIGRLDPKTGAMKLLTPPTENSRPYGIMVDSKGMVYFVEFGANKVGRIDPKTLKITEFELPNKDSRPRRLVITKDDTIWYADIWRGYIGHLDPKTGQVEEFLSPSGVSSQPYGMSLIGDVIWYSESGTKPGTVVRFDPHLKTFQSWPIPGGGYIVRNTSVTPDGNLVLANSLTNEVTLVRIPK